jgi:DNA-binding CsgD family transcriptional regulator
LPFERARARLALGAVQRRAGRRRDGRLTLERAAAGFVELGAPRWLERTEQELGRVAGRQAEADNLTPAEQEVARLVAGGATNREVAARLSISPRTVEAHLGRIYRKLGVRGRSQLAASYEASARARWSRSLDASRGSFEYVVPRTRAEPVTS